jgi:hypothetical protein
MKWFVFFLSFKNQKIICCVSVTLKKSLPTGCAIGPEQAENTNGASSAPVDGKR